MVKKFELKPGSRQVAEFTVAVLSLRQAMLLEAEWVRLFMASKPTVNQLIGRWTAKNSKLRDLAEQFYEYREEFIKFEIRQLDRCLLCVF